MPAISRTVKKELLEKQSSEVSILFPWDFYLLPSLNRCKINEEDFVARSNTYRWVPLFSSVITMLTF